MSELFYPTIDLFIYDLKNPLNADAEKIASNKQAFLSRFPPKTQIEDNENEEEYLQLAKNKSENNTIELKPVNPNLEGYYYPVRLNDTYGLRIDCSVKLSTEPQPIDSFSLIAAEIAAASQDRNLTIGKTWLISGCLTDPYQDTESTAIECYKILFKDEPTPEIYGKGTLFKADIFEIKRSTSHNSDRVIIILFPDLATAEKAAELYPDWMGLFCYRHKVTWAYDQSGLIKKNLANLYKKVESNAEIIENSQKSKVSLPGLQRIFNDVQNILNKYTVELPKLSFQKQVIDINLINYRIRLEQIKQKAGEGSNLDFLDRFSNLAEKKYLAQIEKDAENMQLGLKLLETNINALRSQIELEKSERDLNFQNLVMLVGAGTAIASLFDYKGEKCRAILGHNRKLEIADVDCDSFWYGSIVVPIGFLISIGLIVLLGKWLYIKIVKTSQKR